MAKTLEISPKGPTAAPTAPVDPLDIIVDLLPVGLHNRPGTAIRPTTLTIHNTDNANPGADAAAHNRYIRGADAVHREVSWHFTVDDKSIYQHLPVNEMGWHASAANGSSLGIEICMHKGMDESAAYDRAARLCIFLGAQLAIPMPAGLRQHHDWMKKNCPSVLRSRPGGWQSFLDRVSYWGEARNKGMQAANFTMALPAPTPSFNRGGDRAVLTAISRHFSEHSKAVALTAQARPIPAGDPITFATSSATTRYWPIVTRHPRAMEVNALLVGGGVAGTNASRQFLANRIGNRFHCAIDLYGSEGDDVVVVEDGKIVNFYPFYEGTNALIVQHGGYVVNYGEVAPNSLSRLGLAIGSRVSAGQRIGTIGRLNMLHFETYSSGTTRNYSWPRTSPRPARLRNPSQLLLDLVATANQLDPDHAVPGTESIAGAGKEAVSASRLARPSSLPPMDAADWHGFGTGTREWRYDERGLSTRENGVVTQQRWDRDLDTMHRIMQCMGSALLAASAKQGIPPALLMMTVATETHIYKAANFTGPNTFRWEAHVPNSDVRPPSRGDYSAGPMQSLGTTARWVLRSKGKEYGLAYKPFELAPVYREKPNPKPATHPLYDYAANLDIGAAEIRIRLGTSGLDPIFVAAAYNSGGLYENQHSPWGLRATGDHLDRSAKWYGDACACLIGMGIV